MIAIARLKRGSFDQILVPPHFDQFVERMQGSLEPVFPRAIRRYAKHPLLGSRAQLRAMRCPDSKNDFSHDYRNAIFDLRSISALMLMPKSFSKNPSLTK